MIITAFSGCAHVHMVCIYAGKKITGLYPRDIRIQIRKVPDKVLIFKVYEIFNIKFVEW